MISEPTDREILTELFPMILEFREQLIDNGIHFPAFVYEDVVQMLIAHRDSDNGYCKVFKNQSPSAILVANVFPSPFCNNHLCSQELIWYSSYGVGGVRLLDDYIEWCRSKNVTVTSMKCIAPDGVSYNRLTEFYKKKGFIHMESTFAIINPKNTGGGFWQV